MEHNTAMKMKVQLLHATWINLTEVMLSEKVSYKRVHIMLFHFV